MIKKKRPQDDLKTALIFLLPSLAGFIFFLLIPIISSFLISFTNYTGSFSHTRFIGLQNYKIVLQDSKFWQSISVTIVFVFTSVVLQIFIGFCFALLLNRNLPGRVFFRSILFLPVVLSSVSVCLTFIFIFHPTAGPINRLLESLKIPAIPWLASKSTALLTILFVFIWQSFGYYMILFISGLQSINPALYEMADIDGASGFVKLLYITIPGLSPVIFFTIIIAVINAFKAFDHIYIMTGGQYGGGPAGSTSVLAFDIYKNGFAFWQVGYGAAESVILFFIIFIITVIQFRLQGRWVNYNVI